MVKVVEIDSQGRINLSRKAIMGGGDENGSAPAASAPAPAPRGEEPAGGDRNGAPRGRGRRPPRRD
jgi:polyribonucleotide nucleotidyltransferase